MPGGGGTQLVARRAGYGIAADVLFTGRKITADEAARLHLIDRVVAPGEARSAALELAEQIAGNSSEAVRVAKAALRSGMDAPLSVGLDVEDAAWRRVVASADREEGIRAFVDKRRPNWQ